MSKEKSKIIEGYRFPIPEKLGATQKRIMIGIPMTGTLRSEWVLARYGQVIPCNWSQVEYIQWIDQYSPIRYMVADARNIVVKGFLERGFEWLIFIDHDVVLPPFFLVLVNEQLIKGDIPIFGGLYFTKSVPSEPLIYRGRGNGYFADWKLGEKVWVDGMGMGATIIHNSILQIMSDEAPEYEVSGMRVKKVFDTPQRIFFDPERQSFNIQTGTEDLDFLTRVMKNKDVKKRWPKIFCKEYPFMIDTKLFCRHIAENGIQYPSRGEESKFIPKGQVKKR